MAVDLPGSVERGKEMGGENPTAAGQRWGVGNMSGLSTCVRGFRSVHGRIIHLFDDVWQSCTNERASRVPSAGCLSGRIGRLLIAVGCWRVLHII